MADRKSFISNMLNMFRITPGKSTGGQDIPIPAQVTSAGKRSPIKFNDDLKKLWDWWIKEVSDSPESLKNRIERYADLDYMYYNNTVISMAVEMYADETVQSDSQDEVIQVIAKDRKVEKYILDLFENLGINQKALRTTAFNLSLYGDSFWVATTDYDKGFTEIVPIDVYSVNDRLEFSAIDVQKKLKQNRKLYKQLISRDARLQGLYDTLTGKSKEDIASMFKNFLFGFQIEEDTFLPPWNVIHFRRFSTKSEFYPFGRPLLINSIAPFRMLQATKNLTALQRVAQFPRQHFEVQTDETMTEIEQWNRVNEAREEYRNLGTEQIGREDWGVESEIWTPSGLINFDVISPEGRSQGTDDIELLRDDMILGTRVPKGYLIVDRASFGTSGQALLQQFKPFGRAVYSIQSSILEELVHFVRMQFAMTGDFDIDTEFEINMSFPVIEESQDRLRLKSDSLRLANDILDNLTNTLGIGRGEALPPEVVKKVFGKLSFLDPEDVDEWVDQIQSSKNMEESRVREISELAEKEITDALIREVYFSTKKANRMEEGTTANKRHYVSSWKQDRMQSDIYDLLKKKEDSTIKG